MSSKWRKGALMLVGMSLVLGGAVGEVSAERVHAKKKPKKHQVVRRRKPPKPVRQAKPGPDSCPTGLSPTSA